MPTEFNSKKKDQVYGSYHGYLNNQSYLGAGTS